jgi:hypothetical protein
MDAYGLHNNNIYNNYPYDFTVRSSRDISGTLNYWGSIASVDILSQVYDWYDDLGRGRLFYIPYSQDPDPNSPVPPPTNPHIVSINESVYIDWDPVPSTTTGYGYKVHYQMFLTGPPYNGTGLPQGDSPIDVGNASEIVLTDLINGHYFVAITTYDNLGRDSWYTNEIDFTYIKVYDVFIPLITSNTEN